MAMPGTPNLVEITTVGPFHVSLSGVTLAVLDTVRYGDDGGSLGTQTIEWLDTLGAENDTPVLVFGHHHCWNPAPPEQPVGAASPPEGTARRPRARPGLDYFGIDPDSSESLDRSDTRPAPRECLRQLRVRSAE